MKIMPAVSSVLVLVIASVNAASPKIGIVKQVGSEGISAALREAGYDVAPVARIDGTILAHDVLILPGKVNLGRVTRPERALVQEYVHRGFGVLLTGDACGFRTWYDDDVSPFPQVEHPVGKTSSFALRVKEARHPIAKGLAAEFLHAYWDHIVMELGPRGKTVLEGLNGLPVVVAGEVGRGRVVAMGPFVGITESEEEASPAGDELKLLLNAVEWLAATEKKNREAPLVPRQQIVEMFLARRRQITAVLALEEMYCPLEADYDLLLFDAEDLAPTKDCKKFTEEASRTRARFLDEVRKLQRTLGCEDLSHVSAKQHAELLRQNDAESGIATPQARIADDLSEAKLADLKGLIAELGQEYATRLDELRERAAVLPRKRPSFHPPRVATRLSDLLKLTDHSDPACRRQAALRIGRRGEPAGLNTLLSLLGDSDQEVRIAAINSLAWMRAKKAVSHLLPLLEGRDLRVRRRAIQALGLLRDASIVPKLKALIDDPDAASAENGALSIQWLNGERPTPPVVERPPGYDYDWHLHQFSRVHHLAYLTAMRPWPWSRLAKYAARTHTSAAFVHDREGLELVGQYGLKAARWSGNNKEKMLKDLAEFGDLPAYVVIHYDEPSNQEVDKLAELADFARTLRKDLLFSTVLMKTFAHRPAVGSFLKAGRAVDILCVDPYDGGAMEEAFLMDLQRSCARGVNWVTLSGFVPGPGHSAQDLVLPYAHAQGVWLFVWQYYWKQPVPIASVAMRKYWLRGGRWRAVVKNFRKMAQLEPYLVQTSSVAPTALVFSERSGNLPFYAPPNIGRPGRYFQNQMGLYHALTQEHIQFDSIFAETLPTIDRRRYKVLILSDARALSDAEIRAVKDWVREGGTLIAMGQTSLFDENGKRLPDYALADLFGASFRGVDGGQPIAMLSRHVHRELQPTGPFLQLAVPEDSQTLPALRGQSFKYETMLGYDLVDLKEGAEAMADWENGPAIVTNRHGRGRVIIFTAHYPGLTYVDVEHPFVMGRAWFPQWKDFYDDNTTFLGQLVRAALAAAGSGPRIQVRDCPKTVEARIRTQPGRWMIHFTNYDERQDVRPFAVHLSLGRRPARVFFPEGDRDIELDTSTRGVTRFRTREFHLHDLVVVEMGE